MGMVINLKSQNIIWEEQNNLFNAYQRDIRKYDVLTDEEMKKYLKMYKEGTDVEKRMAKDKIVCSNQRFVLSVAKKYTRGNNILDIINEGNLGLMEALDKFDIESDNKFMTYAVWWIRKRISRYMASEDPMVTPPNAIKVNTYVPAIKAEFFQKNERNPTSEEIAAILKEKHNLSLGKIEDNPFGHSISVNDAMDKSDNNSGTVEESSIYCAYTSSCNTQDDIDAMDRTTALNAMLSGLKPRDAQIIKWAYGIGVAEKMSVEEIANKVNLGEERVRQIMKEGIKKMRNMNK